MQEVEIGLVEALRIQNYPAEVYTGEIVDVQESRDSIVSGDINGSFRSFNGTGFGRVTGSVSTTVEVKKTIFVKLESGKEIQVNIYGDVVALRVGQQVTLCQVNGSYIFMYNHNTEYFYNFCPSFGPWDRAWASIFKLVSGLFLVLSVIIGAIFLIIGIGAFLFSFFAPSIFFWGIGLPIAGIALCIAPVLLINWYMKIPAGKNKQIIDSAAQRVLNGKNIDSYITAYTF